MLVPICYFAFFLYIFLRYRKKAKKSVGVLLLLFYAVSALMTLMISLDTNVKLDILSTTYYIACVFMSLLPFLYLGKCDSRDFNYSKQLIQYLSIFLILFGLIELINSFVFVFTNWSVFLSNIAEIRDGFYNTLSETTNNTLFQKIMAFVRPLQYMTPFCALFYLTRGQKRMAIWCFVASMSVPFHGMTIGERESILVFFSNYAFCYLFFRSELMEQVRNRIKKLSLVAMSPFVLFFIAMSVGRFGQSQGGTMGSILSYGGNQPYFFSYLFNDPFIASQRLGGRFCFQYLFPSSERAWQQLNVYINSDVYLNQFGGMPGSLFFDFAYYSIFIVAAIAFVYYMILKKSRGADQKYPFSTLFLYYFSYQVLFMNIFYLDFIYLTKVFLSVVFYIICVMYHMFASKTKVV